MGKLFDTSIEAQLQIIAHLSVGFWHTAVNLRYCTVDLLYPVGCLNVTATFFFSMSIMLQHFTNDLWKVRLWTDIIQNNDVFFSVPVRIWICYPFCIMYTVLRKLSVCVSVSASSCQNMVLEKLAAGTTTQIDLSRCLSLCGQIVSPFKKSGHL